MIPDVSLIIPSYNSSGTIGKTLESVTGHRGPNHLEVIVVDSSSDGTGDWIEQHYPSVSLLRSRERLPPGPARNLGADRASGDLLGFLDADTVPDPGWLPGLEKRLRQPDISVCAAAVRPRPTPTAAEQILHWIEFSEFLTGLPSGFRPQLNSCNLLMERATFLVTGGFDPELEMAEDLDWSRRVAGGLFFDGSTSVTHLGRTSREACTAHLYRLGFWSGRLRRVSDTSGSGIRRWPLLSRTLPLYRLPRILYRVVRAGESDLLTATGRSPRLLAGLWHWSSGFQRGISGTPAPVSGIPRAG